MDVDLFEAFGSWEGGEYRIIARCRYTPTCRHRIFFTFPKEAIEMARDASQMIDVIHTRIRQEFDRAHSVRREETP